MAKDKDGKELHVGDRVLRLPNSGYFGPSVGVYEGYEYVVSKIDDDWDENTIWLEGKGSTNFKSHKFRKVSGKSRYATKRAYIHARK